MTITELFGSLGDNPYFGAGAGIFGLGIAATLMKKGAQVGNMLFRRHFTMTLEVPNKDKSYNWLLYWITRNSQNTQHMSVVTTFSQAQSGKVNTRFGFIPSPGTHFIRFRRNWIRMERTREKPMAGVDPFESVTLTALGRDKSIYENILLEAREIALQESEGKTIMYTPRGSEWREFGHPRKKRPVSSVVLDRGISSKILTDVQEFIGNQRWYTERGIPYRRGYLLYGPPGCGKSSYITALAGIKQFNCCFHRKMFKQSRKNVEFPKPSIIIGNS